MEANAVKAAVGFSGDERERLIFDHMPQVRIIALRLHQNLIGVDLEDLVSAGTVGLINAVDNFDPSFNVVLKTYAEYKIRGAILDTLRGLDGTPPHKRKRLKRIETAISKLAQTLRRNPDEEEIAAELGTTLEEYREFLQSASVIKLTSVDSGGPDGNSLLARLASVSASAEESMLVAELKQLVCEAMGKIPGVEASVLDLYYNHELQLNEIAPLLDLHCTRISQLKAQGILRLRAYVERRLTLRRQ